MANWYGAARTNYVKIKDVRGLEEYFEQFGGVRITPGEGGFAFIAETEDGDFPSVAFDEEGEEEIEFGWTEVCKYLKKNQVLVVMCAGSEKTKYITGYAEAYNTTTGECVTVSINQIYKKAAKAFNVDEGTISPCEY